LPAQRVALQAIDTDDGQEHVVSHPRARLGSQTMARGGGEEAPRRRGVGCLYVRNIDDGSYPDEGVVEAFAGGEINAARAGNHNAVVSPPPQRLHRVAADTAGATDHGHAHRCPPRDSKGVGSRRTLVVVTCDARDPPDESEPMDMTFRNFVHVPSAQTDEAGDV